MINLCAFLSVENDKFKFLIYNQELRKKENLKNSRGKGGEILLQHQNYGLI